MQDGKVLISTNINNGITLLFPLDTVRNYSEAGKGTEERVDDKRSRDK